MKDQRVPSLLTAILAAILTASCTVGPDYQPPVAQAPADWTEGADIAGLDRGAASAERLAQWWTGFADPVLDDLISQAIAGNHDIRIAAQRIVEARADRTIAAAGGEPTLALSTSAERARQTALPVLPVAGIGNSFLAGLDASWELDLFGKTRRSVEAADAAVDASVWSRRGVLVSLLGEVGMDYTALRAAQARAAIARGNITADQDALDLARQKFEHGLGSELDVAQAEAELEQVQATLPQLATQVAQNAHAIAVLLGKQPGALTTLLDKPAEIPPVPPVLPVGIPSEMLRNRPDIRQAERQLAGANAEVGVAIANMFPSITLSPTIGVNAGQLNKLLNKNGLVWALSGSVGQPIYEGGALEAAVVKAKAVNEEDALNYQRTVLHAFAEVEDALVALSNERHRYERLDRAVEANRLALKRATELYRNGLAPFINVVNSERNLNSTEDSLAQSRQTLTQQSVALYKALGGGWQAGEGGQATPSE